MSDEMRDYFMGLMQGSAITAPIISPLAKAMNP